MSLIEVFEPTECEDQITLLETFQQSKVEDVKVNVTEWITSLIRQRVKLQYSITQEMMSTSSLTSWLVYQRSLPALGTSLETEHRVKTRRTRFRGKCETKLDISKVKCYKCNQLDHFTKDSPFPDKRLKKEEDQYYPSAFTMMCMNEEKDNATEAEEKESEESEEQPEEGEQHNVQEGAHVPMTFEEMLSMCEEQTESAHDSTKI